MFLMERFIQGAILLSLLTAWGGANSGEPYLCALILGILLCVTCVRSLEEEENKPILFIQFVVSLGFVSITGEYISYMVFIVLGNYSETSEIKKKCNLVLPALLYLLGQMVFQTESLPEVVFHIFILEGVSVALFMFQYLMEKYINSKNQISKIVSVTAVNEMYSKKLNQELVIKNYLADKNARLEERENISRNIHNSVGHSITAAIMTLDAADMLFDTAPKLAREKMNIANDRIRTSLDSIRHAVRVLDNENKFITVNDFISELVAVTDSFVMDTMIKIYTDFENVNQEVIIPHEYTEFLTGALKELLSNGVRHGNADIFTVTLTVDSCNIKLKVVDNGKSNFSSENQKERIENGFGLKKMISYIKKCGGDMTFSNENGFKTEMTLKLLKEEMNG